MDCWLLELHSLVGLGGTLGGVVGGAAGIGGAVGGGPPWHGLDAGGGRGAQEGEALLRVDVCLGGVSILQAVGVFAVKGSSLQGWLLKAEGQAFLCGRAADNVSTFPRATLA